MDEGSVRRRRSSAAQQQQQQQQSQTLQRSKLTRQERAIGGATRSKVAAKTQPSVVAVLPSSRKSSSSNNSKSNRSEPQRDRERERDPPQTLSRVAFGRTCSGRQAGHSTLPPLPPLPLPAPPPQARLRGLKQRLDTPRPMAKPMAAAHEQLELLLTRIERGSELDIMPTPTPTSTSAPRRRKLSAARAVRRQMEHPPPVPTVTPLSSARNNYNNSNYEQLQATVATTTTTTTTTTVATTLTNTATTTTTAAATATAAAAAFVPLTQNPQLLSPEKRRALLELLSRAEQHDQQIVNILRSEVSDAGDPSRDAMRLTLQMLPLALKPGDSPYCRHFWAGHRYLKERQKLHQQLQPDDIRYKEVKILRAPDGNFFLSKTLEEELKDEKHVLDFIESELHRSKQSEMTPDQRTRQEKAMEERLELDRQKQQVSECRQRHRLRELKKLENQVTKKMVKKVKKVQEIFELPKPIEYTKKLTVIEEVEKEEEKEELAENENKNEEDDDDDDVTPRPTAAQAAMPEELKDLLMQRQQFREQCQRSNLYNTSNCAAPWKLFANIANKLSAELTAKADDELHRSVAGYIKDFVDNEASIDKPAD